MAKCELCGKTVMFGNQISHFDLKHNRKFKPNVHTAHIMLNGNQCRVEACCRCLRTYLKKARMQKA